MVGLPFIVNTQQSAVEHWKKWWFIHIEYRNATKRLIASSSYILFTFEIPILMFAKLFEVRDTKVKK